MEQIKKNYKDKMKEIMPEQFEEREPSLEENCISKPFPIEDDI